MLNILTKEDLECGRPHRDKSKRSESAYGEWNYACAPQTCSEEWAPKGCFPVDDKGKPKHRSIALQRVVIWQYKFNREESIVETANEQAPVDGFERQKQAFMDIQPDILAPYHGKFVASRNGVIVDSDTDLVALSHRVREQYGNLPIYMTRIGKAVNMPTPFVMR